MKKLHLFTTIISLCSLIACSNNETINEENQTIEQGENYIDPGGDFPPAPGPDDGENNQESGNQIETSNDIEQNNSGENDQENTGENTENANNENRDVLIESLTFNKSEVEIAINRGYQVEYDIKPYNATNKNLRWASTNYLVAAVSKEGKITALDEGNCVITATTMDGSKLTASIDVKVYPIEVTDLDVDIKNKEIKVGDSFKITASVYPSNASNKTVTYTSNDESVAEVNENGIVTGVNEGETDIVICSERYPNIKKVSHVKVIAVIAEKITYRITDIQMREGENYFFSPVINPANTSNKGISYSNDNPNVVSVSEKGEIYAVAAGEATVTATSKSNLSLSTSLKVTVKEKDELVKTTLSYTYKDFANNNLFNVDNANYKNTNALVIPIWFSDSSNYISDKQTVREDIAKAYFGSNEETGWRSVKTFYEEEGRGRYTLTGVVADWFECGLPSSTFYDASSNVVEGIITSAVSWYKKTSGIDTMKAFDADYNGYIDSIILIYGSPDYNALNNLNAANMWAYTSWMLKESYRNFDNPGPNAYFWASYDFMYGESHPHNSKNFHSGDTRFCNIDTHTYIHEFGHVLGLNDYYDYSYQFSPAGGFSMQDQNVGGHDPYSLLTYGFVDPYIVTDSITITIKDFQSSGDVILLSNKNVNSPFDEYILLELYTPTGLNEFDYLYKYMEKNPQGVGDIGIRIWHVDGRLVYAKSNYDIVPEHITTNPYIEGYKVWNMMGNTYYSALLGEVKGTPLGKDYMDYNELQLIRNNAEVTYKSEDTFDSSFLFKQGDTFSFSKFNKQFVNKYYLNDGSLFSFNVEITKIENNTATLTITK